MTDEKRGFPRFEVSAEDGPTIAFETRDRDIYAATLVNVSKEGLGVVSAEEIPSDKDLLLAVDGRLIAVQIQWQSKEGGINRYGVKVISEDQDAIDFIYESASKFIKAMK